MPDKKADTPNRTPPRPRRAILAGAGLTLALIGLLQHQWQRGQQLLEALIAEGEIVEDRVLAHLDHIRQG